MPTPHLDRRAFFAVCSAAGVGSTLFPGVLWALAQEAAPAAPAKAPAAAETAKPKKITKDMIDSAAAVAGITIEDEYKDMMLRDLNDQVGSYEAIRKLDLQNSEQLALSFDPLMAGMNMREKPAYDTAKLPMKMSKAAAPAITGRAPKELESLAFAT